jgi:outer membrane protein assembly factor BamB
VLALPEPTKQETTRWSTELPPNDVRVVVGEGDWGQFQRGAGHAGLNPVEHTISRPTVAKLHRIWSADLPPMDGHWGSPVVAGRYVYIGGVDDRLYVFAAYGCDELRCPPIWAGVTNAPILSGAAVADGAVYVGAGDRLYAFPAGGCGRRLCGPLWEGRTSGKIKWSSPAVAEGLVFIGTSTYDNAIYAFRAGGCGSSMCEPVWVGRPHKDGTGLDTAPAVADGYVYAQEFNPVVYVFATTGCGATVCQPIQTKSLHWETSEAVSPAVTGGSLFAPLTECFVGDCGLDVFPTLGCAPRDCHPGWVAKTNGGIIASPAVAYGTLFVAAEKLYAFDADGCGARICRARWTAATGGLAFSAPLVAGGVVLVMTSAEPGEGGSGRIVAFDAAGCGRPTCKPLWTTGGLGHTRSSLAVANGILYASGDEELLVAFGVE